MTRGKTGFTGTGPEPWAPVALTSGAHSPLSVELAPDRCLSCETMILTLWRFFRR